MTVFSVSELGVISVDTSQIKEDVESKYTDAFGNTLNLSTGTPQGQLINSDVAQLQAVQRDLLALANSFSVLYAIGSELNRAAAFFGYYRKENTKTLVQATLSGTPTTIINSGALVSDGSYEYELLETVVIGGGGTIDGNFQCTTEGNITCLANTLTTIVSTQTGWDTVNNALVGINGVDEESDNAFRQRVTANTLNIQGEGMLGSIIDNIAQLTDVSSIVGRENYTSTPQTIDGVYMVPHSIFLTILGGNGTEIAEVIGRTKTSGTAMNGDTDISYFDINVNYNFVYAIYRPTFVNIATEIQYQANYYTPVDIVDKIKETLIAYIVANPFAIGRVLSGNDIANAFDNFNLMDLLSCKVKLVGGGSFLDYLTFTLREIPVLDETNITVTEV